MKLMAHKSGIIDLYQGGESAMQIARKYRVSDTTVRNLLKKLGIHCRSRREANNLSFRKHYFDERFFDVIDSECKAYWLGFMVAEGNVYDNTVAIELASKDKGHLLLFAKAIQSEGLLDYRPSKDAYRLRLNSVSLVEALAKLGVVPHKSHIIIEPRISSGLLSHFYRGFLDGDGWISRRVSTNTWYIGFASCCGSFLAGLQEWINNQIDRRAGSLIERKAGNCWQLSYSGNNLANQVCGSLYVNATTFLERKFANWQKLSHNREQSVACNKTNIACKLLMENLSSGPKSVQLIMNLAKKSGISEIVFRRCRVKLGIETKRIGFGEGSYNLWSLPSRQSVGDIL